MARFRRDRWVVAIVALFVGSGVAIAPAVAQAPAGARPAAVAGGEILGKLVDSASGRPVTGGSVTVRRAGDSSFASGALPKEDGSFRVDGLAPGRYTLRVRAIGFGQILRNDLVVSAASPRVDVGTIRLTLVAAKLAATEVSAERAEVVVSPDRTNYNVKDLPAASGGTAIDVLRHVPLVEIDGANNVSLRGNSNVVVQINGRSTPLKGDQLGTFLAQLPAGTVKNVEVATNPSAKDDPEGTAGIINIVLSQKTELGLSGGVFGGTASSGQMNGGGNVGKQQGKFVAFVSGNFYHDRRALTGSISRTNLVTPVPASTETRLSGKQSPNSGGGTTRLEYRFDDRNTLSFDGFLYGGRFGGDNSSFYTDLDPDGSVIGVFNQFQSQSSNNLSQDYTLAFRRLGPQNAPVFATEIEMAANRNTSNVDLAGEVLQHDAGSPAAIRTEHDKTIGTSPFLNWKTDYTKQLGTTSKLETGFKLTSRSTTNDFDASYLNASTGLFDSDPVRRTNYDYHEDIGGAYGLFSNKHDKLQTQAGVRLEEAATYMDVKTADLRVDRRYSSAYPSAIVSYAFTPLRSARISYSRRVTRPNPYQLSPVEFRQDSRNVFRGNPNLNAEYTNAVELGLSEVRPWGSVQLNPYVRSTDHAVRNIQFVDTAGTSVSTFANVASTLTIGSDLNVSARRGKLQVAGGGSVYRYRSDAGNLAGNFSVHTTIWSARSNGTWTFNKLNDLQAFLFYRPSTKTEGGSQLAQVSTTFAYRYKAWGDKGNISVRVNDPFKLQKFGYRTANGTVIESSERYFGMRAVYLTFSRNFGQALRLQQRSQDPDAITQPSTGGPPPA